MSRLNTRSILRLVAVILVALILGTLLPTLTYAAGPIAQTAPVEGSIFPALLQVALIVLVTEGIKSLARALGNLTLEGKAAAAAYIVVGIGVYALQTFLLPALPPGASEQLGQFLSAVAVIVGGSGLFSMTSALRVKQPAPLTAWTQGVSERR